MNEPEQGKTPNKVETRMERIEATLLLFKGSSGSGGR
jgi:hypothetical protein